MTTTQELAKQAEIEPDSYPGWLGIEQLEAFRALCVAEALEQAAAAFDGWLGADGNDCAEAIRALKEQK